MSQTGIIQHDQVESRGSRVLKPSAAESWGRLGFCAALMIIGMMFLGDPGHDGITVALVFCGALGFFYYGIKFIIGAPEVRLDDTGFSIINFGREKRYLWTDIDRPFGTYVTGAGKSISIHLGFSVRGERPGFMQRALSRGYTHQLPAFLGLRRQDILHLFNGYWSRAAGAPRTDLEVQDLSGFY